MTDPFQILKRITFSRMFLGKMKKFKTLNVILVKNMSKGFITLKIRDKTDHSSSKYGPSNLLFRFTNVCTGQTY